MRIYLSLGRVAFLFLCADKSAMQNLCPQSRIACFVPKFGKQLSGWLLAGEQVIVVPLRVNVNLKAITVEELIERRKVCHKAYCNYVLWHFLS
jgi:hypothetical protein